MLRCTVALTAVCLLSISAAAESSAGLAAPGDCAQASAGFETPPPFQQAANVGGGAAEHFAPRVGADVLGLLPLDASRTGATRLVDGVVSSTAEGVSGTVDGLTGGALGTTTGTVDALTGTATGTANSLLGGRK
jgi:hypothetical protein